MCTTLQAVKARLEAAGLQVSSRDEQSLFIASGFAEMETGSKISQDASILLEDSGRGVAIFPGEGNHTYEVKGSLSEMAALIEHVYKQYHEAGGTLKEAVKAVGRDTGLSLVNGSMDMERNQAVPIAPANNSLSRTPH